ncbi:MAG: FecR domain-containing protein [Sphingobium limneticum]
MGAIAASLVTMIGVGMSDEFLIVLKADLRTSAGMHLDHRLPDGTVIELDDASAVSLKFTDNERRLQLLKGQVFVDAAPVNSREHRPFIVEAANGEIRALGTSFNVNKAATAVDVTAVTHRVKVTTTGPATPNHRPTLSPGQALRYGADGGIVTRTLSPALATAWRHDRLILDRVTLSEACAILRRHSDAPIRLLDDKGGALSISGVFDARDIEGTLRLIAREHDLRLVKLPLLGFFLT